MKKIAGLILASLSLLGEFHPLMAQDKTTGTPESDAHGNNTIAKDGEWYFKGTVYTDGAAGYGQVEYSGKKEGVAFIGEDGRPAGDIPVPGHILGIGRSSTGILAFYTHEWSDRFYKRIKTINAALLDPVNKKILLDKTVFTNPGDNEVMPEIGNDAAGHFDHLLIRMARFRGETDLTLSLACIYLSPGLEIESHTLSSSAINASFLGTCTGKQGEVFIASQSGDQLIAEQFDRQGQLVTKLSTPAVFRREKHFEALVASDVTADHVIVAAIVYRDRKDEDTWGTFRFDFATGRSFSSTPVTLGKAYRKQLLQGQPGLNDSRLKFLKDLKPAAIAGIGDRIVTISNIDYTSSLGIRDVPPKYTSGIAILSLYDKELKEIAETVIDKQLDGSVNLGRAIGCHVVDGKLFILTAEEPKEGSFADFCYILDPAKASARNASSATASAQSDGDTSASGSSPQTAPSPNTPNIPVQSGLLQKIRLERANATPGMVLTPTTVCWFPDHFILSHVSGEHFLGTRWTTTLQKLTYRDIR